MNTKDIRILKSFLLLILMLMPLLGPILGKSEQFTAMLIFLVSIFFWFTESLPLPITGLYIPMISILSGVMGQKQAFLYFGNQIIFLFLGSFLLAASMQKHHWDKRIAFFILSSKLTGNSLKTLTIVISLICWVLSMWISNTATCAIMTPIALGILRTLKDQFQDTNLYSNFVIRLLLSVAFASSIGGIATPVGSPPNVLAIEFLSEKGIHIDFFGWMLFALPVSFVMLLGLQLLLQIRFPYPVIEIKAIKLEFKKQLDNMGPIKRAEVQVTLSFLLTVILWTLPSLSSFFFKDPSFILWIKQNLSMGVVALLGAVVLFILPTQNGKNLEWVDAKNIDWGTLLIFGGGLCMGGLLNTTGLAKTLGELIFQIGGGFPIFIIGLLVIIFGILISEFSSNTASATIIVPILLGAFSTSDLDIIKMLAIAATLGASFGFMLPVSTPPNAIVYGTGKIPIKEMIKAGSLFDIVGLLIIFFFIIIIFPKIM